MIAVRNLALACALTLFGAACSGSSARPDALGSTSQQPSPTGSAAAPSRTTSGAPSGSATRPPATASTARPGITVPQAGVYIYDVVEEISGQNGPTTNNYEQRAEIDPPVSRDDGVSVEIRTTRASSDVVTGEVYAFRRGAIDVLFADGCALEKPAAHHRFPLRVGASWASPRTCEGKTDTATTRVRSKSTQRINGVEVQLFEIRRTSSLGSVTRTKTQWYSPVYQIVVRSELEEELDGKPHSVKQTLRSLSPA